MATLLASRVANENYISIFLGRFSLLSGGRPRSCFPSSSKASLRSVNRKCRERMERILKTCLSDARGRQQQKNEFAVLTAVYLPLLLLLILSRFCLLCKNQFDPVQKTAAAAAGAAGWVISTRGGGLLLLPCQFIADVARFSAVVGKKIASNYFLLYPAQ
jgi:hypothetical protein